MRCKLGKMFAVTLCVLTLLVVNTPAGETYKQNEQGLEKEFDGFLKAYHKGDDAGMTQAFAIFGIPKAKEWFADHFAAEDVARMSAAYDKQITDGQNALIEDMNRADPGSKFHLRCESRGDVPSGSGKGGSGGIQPVKPVRVEQFVLEFEGASNGQKFLFMANFVYMDGAYRFVGGGGGPFWVKM